MGGDEFIFILRGLKSAEDAIKPAQKILEAIRPPFHVDGHELHVTASIGIGLYPGRRPGSGPAAEVRRHGALSRQGARPRPHPIVQPRPERAGVRADGAGEASATGDRAASVRSGVPAAGRRSDSGVVVGFEALLRWRHPELGLVPPDEFVPLAEENGLIEPLGLLGAAHRLPQHRAWREAGLPSPPARGQHVGAPVPVQRPRASASATCSTRPGWTPRCLELELTESVLMQEGDSTASLLTASERARDRLGARRFRHRLFVAQLSQALSDHAGQDRPLVRARHRQPATAMPRSRAR